MGWERMGTEAIGADFEAGMDAPNKGSPRAFGDWPHHGTLFFFRLVPGALRGLLKFPVGFVGVMVGSICAGLSIFLVSIVVPLQGADDF
jgi:hypothetical protein